MKECILSFPSPLGPPTKLLKFSWEGGKSQETFSIVAGIHGNHLNGIYLCSRLVRLLDSIEAGNESGYYLNSKIQVIPAVNLPAIQEGNRLWSFEDLDMDFAFPGNDQGEVTDRTAAAVYQHTKDSQYGVILYNGNNHYEDAPHLVCLSPNNLTKKFIKSLGPQSVREPENSPTFQLCLYNHWLNQEITSVILSAGKPNHLNKPLCESLFSGLINSLLWAGTLGHHRKKPKTYNVQFNSRDKERFIYASSSGFFVPLVEPGCEIKKGEKIGEIIDLYSCVIRESLFAKSNGYLITLRDYPLVYQREVIAVLIENQRFRLWPF